MLNSFFYLTSKIISLLLHKTLDKKYTKLDNHLTNPSASKTYQIHHICRECRLVGQQLKRK